MEDKKLIAELHYQEWTNGNFDLSYDHILKNSRGTLKGSNANETLKLINIFVKAFFSTPNNIEFPLIIQQSKTIRKWFKWYNMNSVSIIRNESELNEYIRKYYDPNHFYQIFQSSGLDMKDLVVIEKQRDKLKQIKQSE